MTDKPAFEIDPRGLEKILARRGKAFALLELIQNALDENTSRVEVEIAHIPGTHHHRVRVLDDCPEGFVDLSHAYTLFAESAKKVNPEQRGRFNLGEKLVLACCRTATISTTTGTITWEGNRRRHSKARRQFGSEFTGELRMTKAEAEEAEDAARRVLVPKGVALVVNGFHVKHRIPFATLNHPLTTEIADQEGYLRKSVRKTDIHFHEPDPGEVPTLYEMGIPVVELEGGPHVDVQQKVPLNVDRDNVTPGYLRTIRALTLNAAHERLDEDEAAAPWISDALESQFVEDVAVEAVITKRFGDKRVIRDPSDPESTKIAISKGYAVIEPRSFSKDQWVTIRRAGAALPSGQVTPSPKPFDPEGKPLKFIERDEWTKPMEKFVALVKLVAAECLKLRRVDVRFTRDQGWPFRATYARGGSMIVNVAKLGGTSFWGDVALDKRLDLIIHELGHEVSRDHLSEEYHDALTMIGGRLAAFAARNPEAINELA